MDINSTCWYVNKPIGINTLKKMMSDIAKIANLSRINTNQSLRATFITNLSRAGFEARHIRTISGHRCDSSLGIYVRETSERAKQLMSSAIRGATA